MDDGDAVRDAGEGPSDAPPDVELQPKAGGGESAAGSRRLLVAACIVLVIALVAGAFTLAGTRTTGSDDEFVPALPDPECLGSLQEQLDEEAAREVMPVPDSLPDVPAPIGTTESLDRGDADEDEPPATGAPDLLDTVDALRASGIAQQWEDAGVCVIGFGRDVDSFLIDVVDDTLSDELEADTLALVEDGRLTITRTAWEGRPELASWELAPDATVDPATRSIEVLVSEGACASGRSPEGRIGPPEITYGDDTVTIEITVYAIPGSNTCPGNPPTPYTVTLDEPLGDRTLEGMSPPW